MHTMRPRHYPALALRPQSMSDPATLQPRRTRTLRILTWLTPLASYPLTLTFASTLRCALTMTHDGLAMTVDAQPFTGATGRTLTAR
jgi:hypothetical protein